MSCGSVLTSETGSGDAKQRPDDRDAGHGPERSGACATDDRPGARSQERRRQSPSQTWTRQHSKTWVCQENLIFVCSFETWKLNFWICTLFFVSGRRNKDSCGGSINLETYPWEDSAKKSKVEVRSGLRRQQHLGQVSQAIQMHTTDLKAYNTSSVLAHVPDNFVPWWH